MFGVVEGDWAGRNREKQKDPALFAKTEPIMQIPLIGS